MATTTITFDTSNPDSIDTALSTLDPDTRLHLLEAARRSYDAVLDQRILDTIREVLAEDAPGRDAIKVSFVGSPSTNGYFLSDMGDVLFADGTTLDAVDFDLEQLFTDRYGGQGQYFTLTVDLRTGYMDSADLEGLPVPHPST